MVNDVNDHGDAVGWAQQPSTVDPQQPRGFLWHGGVVTELAPIGGESSYASAINDFGVAVGYSRTGNGTEEHATEWVNGGLPLDIDPFGSSFSAANDIAESGEIVGLTTAGGWKPFTLLGGVATQLATLGGNNAAARGVNESGLVVGESDLAGGFSFRAFTYDGTGAPAELTLDGPVFYSQATAVNDSGAIVGSRELSGVFPTYFRAFISSGGVTTALPVPAGYVSSIALAVNDAGEVVGRLGIGDFPSDTAFFWDGTQVRVLDDLLPPGSAWTHLVGATAINDAGQIAGYGMVGGQSHGFVLTPSGATLLGAATVSPVDAASGTSAVTVYFSAVTGAGQTSVQVTSTGPAPPDGFELGAPPTYFDLTTTATFSGPVDVCISYAGMDFGGASPSLWHYESGTWTDVTTTYDPLNQVVCGRVTSFSPFALFRPVVVTPPAYHVCPLFDAAHTAPSGSVLPVKIRLCDAGGANLSSPSLVLTATELGPAGGGAPTKPTAAGKANPGNVFRYDADLAGYVYNLSTKGLAPGSYLLGFVVGSDPAVYSVSLTVG
jgi:uncharacterized membrane protein